MGGVLFRWIPEKEFGFIQTVDGTTYFAHKNSFVTKNSVGNGGTPLEQPHAEIGSVQELKEGMQVAFDKSLNYKTSPPKPFALNIRVLTAPTLVPTPTVRELSSTLRGASSPRPWRPSLRTLSSRDSAPSCEAPSCDPQQPTSWRSSNSANNSGNNYQTYQGYSPSCRSNTGIAPPPGFSAADRPWRSPHAKNSAHNSAHSCPGARSWTQRRLAP